MDATFSLTEIASPVASFGTVPARDRKPCFADFLRSIL